MIPNDPFMLLSWINMQLRDYYPSLDELCSSLNLNRRELEVKLASIDFRYDPNSNSFV
ncbi:MAG TPA: DUF4250 domain-containing protein [Candidatus Merdisoma merdipullorum]|nr:DUF4250 domain-containing protein [Candidatus Merdisoma merdipullorum]